MIDHDDFSNNPYYNGSASSAAGGSYMNNHNAPPSDGRYIQDRFRESDEANRRYRERFGDLQEPHYHQGNQPVNAMSPYPNQTPPPPGYHNQTPPPGYHNQTPPPGYRYHDPNPYPQGHNAMNVQSTLFKDYSVGMTEYMPSEYHQQPAPSGGGQPYNKVPDDLMIAYKYVWSNGMLAEFNQLTLLSGKFGKYLIDIFDYYRSYSGRSHKEVDYFIKVLSDIPSELIDNIVIPTQYFLMHAAYHHAKGGNPVTTKFVDERVNSIIRGLVPVVFMTYVAAQTQNAWGIYNGLNPVLKEELEKAEGVRETMSNFHREIKSIPIHDHEFNSFKGTMDRVMSNWRIDALVAINNAQPSCGSILDAVMPAERAHEYQIDFSMLGTHEGPLPSHTVEHTAPEINYGFGYDYPADTVFREAEMRPTPVIDYSAIRIEELEKHKDHLESINLNRWIKFVRSQNGDNFYTANPYDFAIIAKLMTPVDCPPFDKLAMRRAFSLPLIQYDAESRRYYYEHIDVGSDQAMQIILSNPEELIPFVNAKYNQVEHPNFNYAGVLGEIQELDKEYEANKKDKNAIKVLDEKPKIIFGDKPYSLSETSRIGSTLRGLCTKAVKKFKHVDAVALPFINTKVDRNTVAVEDLFDTVKALFVGECYTYDLKELQEYLNTRLNEKLHDDSIDEEEREQWEYTRDVIDVVTTNIVNRWLVDIAPTLHHGKLLTSFMKEWSAYESTIQSPAVKKALDNICKNDDFIARMQFIGTRDTLKDHYLDLNNAISDDDLKTEFLADDHFEEAAFCARGMVIKINQPIILNPDDRKLIYRSNNPEIYYIIDKVMNRSQKYFHREAPVYLQLRYKDETIYWGAEKSAVDDNVITLTPMDTSKGFILQALRNA